jgi:hypothetical protein
MADAPLRHLLGQAEKPAISPRIVGAPCRTSILGQSQRWSLPEWQLPDASLFRYDRGEGRLSICGRPLPGKGKRWGRCCAWSDAVICGRPLPGKGKRWGRCCAWSDAVICGRPLPGKGNVGVVVARGRMLSSVDAPFQARENVGVVVARGRMLSSVRPLMRQEDSRRPVREFADWVQITQSVLEAQWKALVVPAPSRRLLRHTLLRSPSRPRDRGQPTPPRPEFCRCRL